MNEFFPLASAAGMTVGLAVCALIVGLALAMFFAVWESAKWRPVAWAGSALVTILRGLPEILVVLFIYFGSSQLLLTLSDGFTINLGFVQIPVQMDIENFDVSPFLCGVIALSLLYAAYASQTLRGALKAVPVGQWESGQALGLSKSAIFFRLVIHMQNVAVRPRDINPNIPSGLEEIIMHAMEKDASKRYQTAAEMIRDIEAFKANNQIIFGYYNAPEPTQYFTPPETGNRRVPQRERVAYEQNGGGGRGDYYEDYPPENEPEPEQSKSLVIPILTAVTIVVLVVAAIVIFLIVGQGTNGSNSSTDEVPKVIGMNYDDAVLNYPNIDFEVAEQDYTDKYEENIIYKQSIEAGQFVKKNKDGKIELAVAVSKGVQKVQIPDLTNYTAQEAEDALKALGLTAEQKKTQSTSEENIEADHVIRTDPAMNEEVAVGSNVVIYVSQGVAVDETDVPKFVGMTQEDAQKEADSRKLKLEITEVPSTEEKGIVTEQDPEPGKVVVSGSTIKLNVSNGEQPEGEVTYGLENLPVSNMSGMYTLSFTTDEDGVIASRQFVAESLTNASVSVKVKGKGSKVVKVSITSAQSGKTEVLGTYTFDFANKKFTASSENIEGALSGVAVQTVPAVTAAPAETAAPDGAPSEVE